MGLKDFFKRQNNIEPDELRRMVEREPAGSITILDVRQPKEYNRDHLPGATLIPLPQLADRLSELDPDQPTVAYCAVGGRSSMATRFLAARGFGEVYNLAGGIKAWQGEVATGPVGVHLPFVEEYDSVEKALGLAYRMEHSVGRLYRSVIGASGDAEVDRLLDRLARWEDEHKAKVAEQAVAHGVPQSALEGEVADTLIEGGFELEDFLEANETFLRSRDGVLEVAMMVEAHALDLYLRIAGGVHDQPTAGALLAIADEEKAHLRSLGELRGG